MSLCFGEDARAPLEPVEEREGIVTGLAPVPMRAEVGPLFGPSKSVLVKLLTVAINKMYIRLVNNDFVRILY